jgi:hypothetical protein
MAEIDNSPIYAQMQLKKDQIVGAASRMVKDHDSDNVRGMTEIPYRFIEEINNLLFELDQLRIQAR